MSLSTTLIMAATKASYIDDPNTRVLADGIIPTLNSQLGQVSALVSTAAAVIVTCVFLAGAAKSGFTLGKILGSLIAGAIVLFAVNGGMVWAGGGFKEQLGA